jgi:hypothetical protein
LLDSLHITNTLRLTVANPAPDLSSVLAGLQPAEMAEQPVDFAEAVTAYMSENRNRGFLMETLGGAA